MKILMIGRDLNIFTGGSGVRERLKKLAAEVGEITDLTFTKITENKEGIIEDSLTAIPTSSRSILHYIQDAVRLGKRLSRPDIITTQDPFLAGLAGLWLKKFWRVPLEVQIHTDVFSSNFKTFSLKNFIYYGLARFVLKSANQVRVVSEKVRRSVVEQNLIEVNKMYTLPIFVKVPEKVAGLPHWFNKVPEGARVIFMAGRLEREKRYDLALKAFAKLADKNTVLVIAGSGSLLHSLQDLALKLGVNGRVLWVGALNPEEMVCSYEVAHLFFHTSAYEGYGLVLAEAALVGLPIVSTRVGIALDLENIKLGETVEELVIGLEEALATSSVRVKQMVPMVTDDEYYQELKSRWQSLSQS